MLNINVIMIENLDEKAPFIIQKQMIFYGQTHLIQVNNTFYLTVGMNKTEKTMEDIRFLGGETRKAIDTYDITSVSINFDRMFKHYTSYSNKDIVVSFMEGWYLAGYSFLTYQMREPEHEVSLQLGTQAYEYYAEVARVRANAVCIARDLCNEPANKLTPNTYVKKIRSIFHDSPVHVEILESEEDLLKHGLEATAIVGKGSSRSPKFAVLTLKNSNASHIGLVGKGVTFDSGGTNSKIASDIGEMKMDMGGSAAVIGAMKLLADMESPVHVTAAVPIVENVCGKDAFLPSDVIKYRNGLTVEVGNTDAEGRLIVADGILYVQDLGADTIIDIATLTGTIGQALGLKVAGIFSNRENELWKYKELGDKTGDHVWPMPVINEYQYYLQSNTADFSNMSSSKFGGAITAALYLNNFIQEEKKWIHIDMANTVRPWREIGYYVSGASGFGVRLLTELILEEVGNKT